MNTYKISTNRCFALLLSVAFCHYTLFMYIEEVIGKLPLISMLSVFFFPVLYFILFILSYKSSTRLRIHISAIGIFTFFMLEIMLTYVFHPDNVQYIESKFVSDILPCIPFFWLGLSLTLDDDTYNTVSLFSCIAIIISTLYLFYYMGSGRLLRGSHGEDYSMYWSYLLLPNTMIAIEYTFKRKKIFSLVCSIVGVVYAFVMGTRGAIIILFAYIITCIWRYLNISIRKKILSMMALSLISVGFVVSPVYLSLLKNVRSVLENSGVSTRIVDYLISGGIVSYTSGRDIIYLDLLGKLAEKPLLGWGVYGEYPLGYDAGAHNLYLEVVFNFGYPLGIILLISFIILYIKALKRTKGKLVYGWIVLFGCLVFIKGIFGGSYLDYSVFFLLGMCLKEIRFSSKNTTYRTD